MVHPGAGETSGAQDASTGVNTEGSVAEAAASLRAYEDLIGGLRFALEDREVHQINITRRHAEVALEALKVARSTVIGVISRTCGDA